jgi:hypothetical protein
MMWLHWLSPASTHFLVTVSGGVPGVVADQIDAFVQDLVLYGQQGE